MHQNNLLKTPVNIALSATALKMTNDKQKVTDNWIPDLKNKALLETWCSNFALSYSGYSMSIIPVPWTNIITPLPSILTEAMSDIVFERRPNTHPVRILATGFFDHWTQALTIPSPPSFDFVSVIIPSVEEFMSAIMQIESIHELMSNDRNVSMLEYDTLIYNIDCVLLRTAIISKIPSNSGFSPLPAILTNPSNNYYTDLFKFTIPEMDLDESKHNDKLMIIPRLPI